MPPAAPPAAPPGCGHHCRQLTVNLIFDAHLRREKKIRSKATFNVLFVLLTIFFNFSLGHFACGGDWRRRGGKSVEMELKYSPAMPVQHGSRREKFAIDVHLTTKLGLFKAEKIVSTRFFGGGGHPVRPLSMTLAPC